MKIESILDRLLAHKVIVNCNHEPYLYRWYLLRTKRVAIFIHKFTRSDEDRALHDHPWDFFVLPVWRGYIEHSSRNLTLDEKLVVVRLSQADLNAPVPMWRRVLPIIGARFRRGEYRHRVELIDGKPAWSIFIRFTERRAWGFWPREGFTAWNKWWQDKCE